MKIRNISWRLLRSRNFRKQNGSVGILIPGTILLMVLGTGALAGDIAHNTMVRAELQNACDAGALAGASAMISSSTISQAANYAKTTCAANKADGESVSSQSPNTSVTVRVNTKVAGEMGECQVSASHQIQNWLAKIFEHGTDTITVTSTAACSATISEVAANSLFPLAVSIDAIPQDKNGSGKSLETLKLGDIFQIYINSQQVKNGGFTSMGVKNTNANWLNQAMDQALGLKSPEPNFIPSVKIGDPIYLDNGVSGQKTLASDPRLSALKDRNLALPVVEGTPPFNQSRPIIGWVVVRIQNVSLNKSGGEVETLTGTIVKTPIRGAKGSIPDTGDPNANTTLQSISPGSVRLIPNASFAG
ncbi:MAG: Tad domain-containing protein [Candidatus Obscuribacterales bacterium]|nr:Tad domain-containing protein [Candidatus Obscuribacterales bacterium]